MSTIVRIIVGFSLGWVSYMVAMVLTVYDGALSLIFQPIMAAVVSGLLVVAALVVGLPLRIPKVSDAWSSCGWWPILLTVAAIGVLIFYRSLGLEVELVHPETKEKIRTIAPVAGFVCYFAAVFFVVNLPRQRPNKAPEPTPGAVTPRATEGVSK